MVFLNLFDQALRNIHFSAHFQFVLFELEYVASFNRSHAFIYTIISTILFMKSTLLFSL